MNGTSVLRIAFLAAVLALAPSWATAAEGDSPPDAWVTTKAKIAVLTAVGTAGTNVNVDTVDGRVTLHGAVASDTDKQEAERAARKIDGVKEVRNLLEVIPPEKREEIAAKDDEIRTRVRRALEQDEELRESAVEIESVNKGTVLLSGRADSLSQHLRAIQVAKTVEGVTRVASEIQSPDAEADAEIFKDSKAKQGRTEEKGRGVLGAAGDAWMTSKVKTRLLAKPETPGMDVSVDTRDGVVTLFGTVPDEKTKTTVETEATKVDGVKKVVNQLEVVGKAQKEAVTDRDQEVEAAISTKLERDPALAGADVDVEVADGVARLTGTVKSAEARTKAKSLARGVEGVRSVEDEIEVRKSATLKLDLGEEEEEAE